MKKHADRHAEVGEEEEPEPELVAPEMAFHRTVWDCDDSKPKATDGL